ncbi:MAG: Na+/H+ antiporter subunit E [Clostridiales bacterium]|nr:Na+/H+ antiporter subunit E [Clostridiales bacterium]
MFIIFFAFWVIFNGRWTAEIAGVGLVLSGVLYLFCRKYLGYSPRKEWRAFRQIPRYVRYAFTLLWEIVKANLILTRIVLRKKPDIHPRLVTFRTPLKRGFSRTVLADSITLTPGTITVLVQGDELTVHCLDAVFAEGTDDLVFQRQLLTIEREVAKTDA